MRETLHYKDEGLDRLSRDGYNVAQFISYDDKGEQRFSRTIGNEQNHKFASPIDAAQFMLANTTEHSVNIRSFDPRDPKSKPFERGISTTDGVISNLRARQDDGLHTIVNESIDINDGGVSGVAFGNIIEFSPYDTPRCVEKPGTVQFTRAMGASTISKVYGFLPTLAANPDTRLEFSIHPLRRGYRNEHTVIWEAEQMSEAPLDADTTWPNRFSDMLGDKTFGLIIADELGLYVPRTTVFNRTVAPFTFGRETGSHEAWLRTAPNRQAPGLYTTTHGWQDPYTLMSREDPTGENIASILRQDGIDAKYSGACIMGADDKVIIEGKEGKGDSFMVGDRGITALPAYIRSAVRDIYKQASDRIGPVRFEWVYDGVRVWVVQLHQGKSVSTAQEIVPGSDSTSYLEYQTAGGIDGLRELIAQCSGGTGITLVGNVGVTSHFGDLLRKASVPSRIVRTQD